MSKLTYTEELITPEIATRYLQHNTHNRNPKDGRIAAYAVEMRNGQWCRTGEAIKFSESDVLIDGQNRLMAIVRAGVSVWMLVIRGVEDRAQEVMDIGAPRSMADVLALRGEKSVNNLAAVIRALHIWDATEDSSKRIVGASGQSGRTVLSVPALLRYFDSNAEVCRHICSRTDQFRKATKIPTSISAPLIREMERIDQDDADDFTNRVQEMLPSPRNHGENDPLVQLYKRMRQMMDSTKTRYIPTELAALIVKAWNSYRDGTELVQLRWRSGGSAPEAFPVMH